MGFDAGDVKPLDYNFREYGDGETHIIKEPSRRQVRKFWGSLAKEERVVTAELQATVAALDGETPEQTNDRLTAQADALADAQMVAADASRLRVLGYLSDVCSGDPSVEALEKLPERLQVGFLADIRGELTPKG